MEYAAIDAVDDAAAVFSIAENPPPPVDVGDVSGIAHDNAGGGGGANFAEVGAVQARP